MQLLSLAATITAANPFRIMDNTAWQSKYHSCIHSTRSLPTGTLLAHLFQHTDSLSLPHDSGHASPLVMPNVRDHNTQAAICSTCTVVVCRVIARGATIHNITRGVILQVLHERTQLRGRRSCCAELLLRVAEVELSLITIKLRETPRNPMNQNRRRVRRIRMAATKVQ